MRLTVRCVSDSPLYAEALNRLLQAEPWVAEVTAQVGITRLGGRPLDPPADVALVVCAFDLQVHWIRTVARSLRCRVVAVGVTASPSEVVQCAEAGASGFFFRDQPVSELHDVIAAVMRDEVICPPRASGALLHHVSALANRSDEAARLHRLTARELQVLDLLRDGRSNKEIAHGLGIDQCTVKNHVHNILGKLQVARRGEAAAVVLTNR